jgi:hypothetical protein
MELGRPAKLDSKNAAKNWPQKLALGTGRGVLGTGRGVLGTGPGRAGNLPRALRIERKMPESQSRLDPNPGFG